MILKYLQLPFRFNAPKLQAAVAALLDSTWQPHYQRLHYTGEWTALPLRSIGGQADNILISPVPGSRYEDTVFLKASHYLQEVLAGFECPLLSVRLLRLAAGAVIREHRDIGLCYEQGEIRLHIPVTTHPEVAFYLDGERMQLEEGSCWYLNFNLPHSIRNDSPVDRVHLVIDAAVNDWVRDLFAQAPGPKKMMAPPESSPELKRQLIAELRRMNTGTSLRIARELEAGLTEG